MKSELENAVIAIRCAEFEPERIGGIMNRIDVRSKLGALTANIKLKSGNVKT